MILPVERYNDPLAGPRLRLRGTRDEAILRRVVAGLAWPRGSDPGAVVALGEYQHKNPEWGLHPVLVLAHAEQSDLLALFLAARTIRDTCLVVDWVGDTTHPFMARLDDFDDGLRQRKQPRLAMDKAPLVGESGRFQGYADMLRARVAATKTMTFGPHFQDLARALQAISPQDELSKQPEHYPGPCALFYALAEIDMNQPVAMRPRKKKTGDPKAGY
jgi:hypothetical protein